MDFDTFLNYRMNEMENKIRKVYRNNKEMLKDFDDDSYKELQVNRIGKEYHDTRNNDIGRIESIYRITLDSFDRTSYESSYNNYIYNSDGSPSSIRRAIKGYIYKDTSGDVACKILIEKTNENSVIKELYVNPRYHGHGLVKSLIDIAKTNFKATGAICDASDMLLMHALKANHFQIVSKIKNGYYLTLDEAMTHTTSVAAAQQREKIYKPLPVGHTPTNTDGTSGKNNSVMNIKKKSMTNNNGNNGEFHDRDAIADCDEYGYSGPSYIAR